MQTNIRGASVLMPNGDLIKTTVVIGGAGIAAVGGTPVVGRDIDASGLMLLPGIVDLHGDAFERQLMPRPHVRFPFDLALLDTDRQLVANGISTALHGVTWSWEPGLRCRETTVQIFDALKRLGSRLGCDNHVHLRHEAYNVDAADEIEEWLADGRLKLLAFNDHWPMLRRKAEQPGKIDQYAERANMSVTEFTALIDRVAEHASRVPETVGRLAEMARRHGVALASHDDDTPEVRRRFHALGCRLCEFPLNRATAEESRRLGDAVIMGAPNIVRGGSHLENGIRAADMVAAGLVDALTSDYYYPALVHAAFRLVRDGILDLGRAWALISANPARLTGFHDRGAIEPGRRADLLLVDGRDQDLPQVVATMVAGRMVFALQSLCA